MSIPRNLGNFADNVNANGKVEVTGINATGTPSASTVLYGNGTWAAAGGGSSQWTTSGSNIYYNTGNVGIGTSSPVGKLQLAQTNNTTLNGGSYINLGKSENGVGGYHLIGMGYNQGSNYAPAYMGFVETSNTSGTAGDLVMFTRPTNQADTVAPTERMRLDSSGKLTIGGATPLGTFNLVGLSRPSGVVTYTSAASSANAQSGLNWYQDNNTNYEYYLDLFATATSESPWGGSNIRMLTTPVGTNTAVERAKINRNGNFLVGRTPSFSYSDLGLIVPCPRASGVDSYAGIGVVGEPTYGIAGMRLYDSVNGGQAGYIQSRDGSLTLGGPSRNGFGTAVNGNITFAPLGGAGFTQIISIDSQTPGIRPMSDNAYSCGAGSNRWSVVYAATGTINTSDEKVKQQVKSLNDAEKNVAKAIKNLFVTFKYNNAVEEKGDDARIHVGVIAQQVQSAFIAEGLDPTRYALFCSDTWWETTVEEQAGGFTEKVTKISKTAVEGWTEKTMLGIRYEQLLAFVIASM